MKKRLLLKYLLSIGLLAVLLLVGCANDTLNDIPTENISSILNVLDDDASGITWANQSTIELGAEPTIKGKGISRNGSVLRITKGGNYTLSGKLTNGSLIVDTKEAVNLTLNNASISNPSGPAIQFINAQAAYITLVSDTNNFLVDGNIYSDPSLKGTLTSEVPLTIQGNGMVSISSKHQAAISCADVLNINNGVLNISSEQDGILNQGDLTLNGGKIAIENAITGLNCNRNIFLNNGVVSISASANGIFSMQNITVCGATINADRCTNGINSLADIVIDDGNLNLASDSASLLSDGSITINNGNIHLKSTQKAIQTKGSLTINNGITLALTDSPSDSSIQCDQLFSVNGGTFLATGGNSNFPNATTSLQYSTLLTDIPAHMPLHVESKTLPILTFQTDRPYKYMFFSSPLLTKNETYDIYLGGIIKGGTNFYGLYNNASYEHGILQSSFVCSDILFHSTSFLTR